MNQITKIARAFERMISNLQTKIAMIKLRRAQRKLMRILEECYNEVPASQ